MANDINRVVVAGRLVRDPEMRHSTNGNAFCRFSIANGRTYTAGGERREETSFLNCVAWGKQAELVAQYMRKGRQVIVDGRLQQRSWQNDQGQKQSIVEIVTDRVQFLGGQSGDDRSGGGGGDYGSSSPYPGSGGSNFSSGGGGSASQDPGGYDYPPGDYGGGDDEDDIPF